MRLTIGQTDKTLRLVADSDHDQLAAWIAADSDHRELTTVEFFSEQAPGQECYVVEDPQGSVFYLKITRAARVDIQFPPEQDHNTRARIREGLIAGFGWLAGVLETKAFRQVVFSSKNDILMRSMEKRLGFVRSPGEMVRWLGSPRKDS